MFLGKILAFASMQEGKEVTWFPSYGAEMRGGTANCTVIVSESLIGSPVVQNPDILIAMNKASLSKFQKCVKKNGLILFDSSLITGTALRRDIISVSVPATRVASSLLNTKSANMVLLGALISLTGLLKKASFAAVFRELSRSDSKGKGSFNLESFMKGFEYIENSKG